MKFAKFVIKIHIFRPRTFLFKFPKLKILETSIFRFSFFFFFFLFFSLFSPPLPLCQGGVCCASVVAGSKSDQVILVSGKIVAAQQDILSPKNITPNEHPQELKVL